MASLDEILDRVEQRVSDHASCQVDTIRMEEVTSRLQYQEASPQSQPTPLLTSATTIGTGTIMAHPLGVMTREEIEEFAAQKVKQQKDGVMPHHLGVMTTRANSPD